jgi:hypothetical protein
MDPKVFIEELNCMTFPLKHYAKLLGREPKPYEVWRFARALITRQAKWLSGHKRAEYVARMRKELGPYVKGGK